MKRENKEIEKYRLKDGPFESDETYGNNGMFIILCKYTNKKLKVIASDQMNWEHVSVSLTDRTPLWKEMCFIKDLFWSEEETVIQYHPKKSEYVNNHENCLHLWKPLRGNILYPPSVLVGIK